MKFNKEKAKDVTIAALVVMAIQFLLSAYVYPFLNIATSQVFGITAQTAINSPTIGTKIVSFISGIIPVQFSVPSILTLFIGAWLLIFVGLMVYEKMPSSLQGKSETWRIWLILLYGTVALYLVLLLLNMSSISTLGVPLAIGLAINYGVIALIYSIAASKIKILKI